MFKEVYSAMYRSEDGKFWHSVYNSIGHAALSVRLNFEYNMPTPCSVFIMLWIDGKTNIVEFGENIGRNVEAVAHELTWARDFGLYDDIGARQQLWSKHNKCRTVEDQKAALIDLTDKNEMERLRLKDVEEMKELLGPHFKTT